MDELNTTLKLKLCTLILLVNIEVQKCLTLYKSLSSFSDTSEENRVAERFNCTLLEGIRTLLTHGGMGKRFWVNAGKLMVYILNCSAKRILQWKSPYEILYNSTPSLKLVHVFGCYGHVLRDKQYRIANKVGVKIETMLYLGIDENEKTYIMWNPKTQRVVCTREVTFDEYTVGPLAAPRKTGGRNH